MKKCYAFVIALISAGAALAQPTITSAAMPQAGFIYNMIADTAAADMPTFTVSAGSASAQTWNYTAEFANVYGEATSFVAASSGTGSTNFPGATLTAAQSNGTDWVYFNGNTNGFYLDGVYMNFQGTMVAIDLAPNALIVATPSTYGYTNNTLSTATFTASMSGNTFQVRHYGDRTVSADAFGTLTIPSGTYPNTLRVKAFEATIDSVFVDIFGSWNFVQLLTDSTTTYTWFQNSQDAQLLQIEMDKANAVTKAQYLQSFSNGIAQIDAQQASLSLYPNPVSEVAHLSYENKTTGPVTLQMYDVDGRLVADFLKQDQAIGKQKIYLNIESLHLPRGIYFLRLRNNEGLQTLKMSVN